MPPPNPSTTLYDSRGDPIGAQDGGLKRLQIFDLEVGEALQLILRELRIMNEHLAAITGENISSGNVE